MKYVSYLPPGGGAALPVRSYRPTVEQMFMLLCCVTLFLNVTVSQLRLFTYLIPVSALVLGLAIGRLRVPEFAWPFVAIVIFGLATAPLATPLGWQDIYLMMIGLSPFAFGLRMRASWRTVFLVTLGAFAVSVVMRKVIGGGGMESFDLATSRSPFESPLSFVFGMLAVWAAAERRWKPFLLALAMTVLTLKRIALGGVLLCFLVALLPDRGRKLLINPVTMLALNITLLVIAVMYGYGVFDRLIHDLTGQSANQFGMGRRHLLTWPSRELIDNYDRYLFLGAGAGQTYEIMKGGLLWLSKYNLHSDLVKIVLDYGAIAFVTFFVLAYRVRSSGQRMLWAFFNILLFTDNALIYSFMIFMLCLCCASLEDAREPGAPAAGPAGGTPGR